MEAMTRREWVLIPSIRSKSQNQVSELGEATRFSLNPFYQV